ncbi:MAG: hypothetical protein IOD15_10780 [Phycisphaerales bacterium]|jgi:hypothetical protein|nr:hypothetical protein [Phycisphaerales bacterium]
MASAGTPTPASSSALPPGAAGLLSALANEARATELFGEITLGGTAVRCAAANSAAPAEYSLSFDGATAWVSLTTPDRYLSQSIEQDLVHTGDKLGDLLLDELIDLAPPGDGLTKVPERAPMVEHFRSPDKLFTFRVHVPLPANPASSEALAVARLYLLAMEACFRPLGDMDAGDDED